MYTAKVEYEHWRDAIARARTLAANENPPRFTDPSREEIALRVNRVTTITPIPTPQDVRAKASQAVLDALRAAHYWWTPLHEYLVELDADGNILEVYLSRPGRNTVFEVVDGQMVVHHQRALCNLARLLGARFEPEQ